MTHNQIAYWNLQETIRSNQAREAETQRTNMAQEAEANRAHLAQEWETNRSNLARESENERSNRAREEETKRHNQVAEALGWAQHEENKRANLAREEETKRTNIVNEGLTRERNLETKRHNQMTELLDDRRLSIQENANAINYEMALRNLELGYDNLNFALSKAKKDLSWKLIDAMTQNGIDKGYVGNLVTALTNGGNPMISDAFTQYDVDRYYSSDTKVDPKKYVSSEKVTSKAKANPSKTSKAGNYQQYLY
nr:hypothetical protein [Picobirnavirus sp.]